MEHTQTVVSSIRMGERSFVGFSMLNWGLHIHVLKQTPTFFGQALVKGLEPMIYGFRV